MRATNEAIPAPEPKEESKNGSLEQECEAESKENEAAARKQKLVSLPRSDSIGSTSGRKYLAPTLSDPAARPEKERITTKKKNSRHQAVVANKNFSHLNESESRLPREVFNNKTTVPKATSAMHEIRDWWNEQLAYISSSDED